MIYWFIKSVKIDKGGNEMRKNILLVLTVLVMITVTVMPAMAAVQCDDNIDNDGDGYTDMADPGCSDSWDDDESNPAIPEFPTIALPVMAVIGIMFLLHRKKN
jgi:hypothetical protein